MRSMLSAMVACAVGAPAWGVTRYVDASAPSGGDGQSWATAHRELHPALFGLSAGMEVRVAQGVYTPAGPGGTRISTFNVPCAGGVVRGGYAGLAGANPDERDPAVYVTVLSGDLNGDDAPGFVSRGENSWHVVTIDFGFGGPQPTIEGVTITGGFANGGGTVDNFGGGLIASGCPVTLRDCVLIDNHAEFAGGGAMIVHNAGNVSGGAVLFERCRVIGNRALGGTVAQGGGVYFRGAPISTALSGAFVSCEFRGNSAGFQGGGLYVERADALVLNSLFGANETGLGDGSAAAFGEGHHRVISCTVADNECFGGIGLGALGAATVFPGGQRTVTASDSIVWGNAPGPIGFGLFGMSATYCDIEGAPIAGVGNIDVDPAFVSAPGGDYSLSAGSACIDAGSVSAFLNAGAWLGLVSDLARGARFVDDPGVVNSGSGGPPAIDIGAYEFVPPPLGDPCPVDTNGDGVIDFLDLNHILGLFGSACP